MSQVLPKSALRHFTSCVGLVAGLLLPVSAHAQSAQISGIVTDPDGQAIADANITVRNEGTGVLRTTSTTDEGHYAIPAVPPGAYTLRARKPGFKSSEYPNIVLQVDAPIRFDVTLTIGEVVETVYVQANAAIIQETPQIGTSVTRREYESLPMIQLGRIRSPATFVLLAPGVQGTVRLDGTQNANASNHVQVHGQANFTMEYLVDGLVAGPGYGNFNESAPAVGAVDEFRVITSQLPAEYGATGAAVTSFLLRSGTNQLHGDLYNYARDSALDAQGFLSTSKPELELNEFGGSFGGPIVIPKLYDGANRSFFFFSYGGSRKRGADGLSTALIPTPQQRLGDFSDLSDGAGRPKIIYDPATTRTNANGVLVRDPFPGNVIPADRIDPAAAAIASYYPTPNSPGGYTGTFGETLLDPSAYTGKVDHNIGIGNRLSGAVVRTDIPRVRSGTPLPSPLDGPGAFRQHVTSWTLRANHDVALSSNLLNSLAVGYNDFATPLTPPTEAQNWSSALGIPGISTWAFPSMTFGNGYQAIGSTNYFDFDNNTFVIKDAVSWQRGAHFLKFGGEWRYNWHNSHVVGTTHGDFNFTNTLTASPTALSTTGDSFASFLLGGYNRVSATGPIDYSARWTYGGLYAQDEWRATPSLTLTYGLRWEWQTPTRERQNINSTVDLGAPNPGAGGRPGALVIAGQGREDAFGKTDLAAIGPRVGFTWQPRERVGIRGGYGIYYAKYTSGINYFGLDNPGFQATLSRVSSDNGLTAAGRLSDGLPALSASAAPSPTLLNGQAATYIDPSAWKLPRMQNWSASFQHQLGRTITWEASYVGMRGTRQNAYLLKNINQVDSKYLALGALLTQSVMSPAAVAAGISPPYPGFTGSVAQALRPYPQYQTLTSFYAKPGENTYHALELRLGQRFNAGLSFDIHYTWSRSEGYADTANIAVGGVNNLLLDAHHPESERSLLPIDVPHAVVASWIYALPGSGIKNDFLRALLGGWTIAGVHRYQSGTPLQIVADNNLPLFNRVQRPNLVPGQDPQTSISAGDFNRATDRRINLAAFASPPPFTFGNSPPTMDNLRNFAVLQEDLAITKRIALRGPLRLEAYAQAFNLFNRHRFTSIVTNFSSPSFGSATGASLPRYIQLGAKVIF